MHKTAHRAIGGALAVVVLLGLRVTFGQEPPPTITQGLAAMALETKADAIPRAAHDAVKRTTVDDIGAALAGHNAPGVTEVLQQYREWGGKPEASVWFHADRLPGPEAAFVNSVQSHALDLDDYHGPSDTHITAVILPVALAVGEITHASGKETLAAAILGVEVAGCIGRAFKKQRANEGFLPTSVVGGFGATATACRLKKLSVDQTVNALGIFYAHASGNRQALFDRTLAKRLQPAIAARAAVFAACLAERGLTGPRHAVEGPAGLLRIYAGSEAEPLKPAELGTFAQLPEPSKSCHSERSEESGITRDEILRCAQDDFAQTHLSASREIWEVELIRFKRYASCGRSHDAIRAAIDLANENGLKPEDIAEIELFGVGVNSGMVGVPWDPKHSHPQVLAQFCAPYEVATAIRNRRMGAAEISDRQIRADREVSDLALRTRLCDPKDFGGKYPGGQTVRIRTRQGQTLVASRKQTSNEPFSKAELIAKFEENAAFSGICPPPRAVAMLQAIERLDQCDDVSQFVRRHLINP